MKVTLNGVEIQLTPMTEKPDSGCEVLIVSDDGVCRLDSYDPTRLISGLSNLRFAIGYAIIEVNK